MLNQLDDETDLILFLGHSHRQQFDLLLLPMTNTLSDDSLNQPHKYHQFHSLVILEDNLVAPSKEVWQDKKI